MANPLWTINGCKKKTLLKYHGLKTGVKFKISRSAVKLL